MNALLWEELELAEKAENEEIIIERNELDCLSFLKQKEDGKVGKPRVARDIFELEANKIIASIDKAVSNLASENVASKVFTHSIFSSELTIVVDQVGKWDLETDAAN